MYQRLTTPAAQSERQLARKNNRPNAQKRAET